MKTLATFRVGWLLALACLSLAGARAVAGSTGVEATEYQIKATYVYNFTKFADWPAGAFASSNAPIVISIIGEDPFGSALDDIVRGELVRNRQLVIKRFHAGDDLANCHVLFICRSEKEHLPQLLEQLKGRPVLTVSDMDGFAGQGGMLNLLVVRKTVKMEINQEAAADAGLQISVKLLKLARLVKAGVSEP